MTLVRPVPGFVPPVVAIPAANTIVPFIPGVVGVVAGTGATIAGAPALGVIGAAVAGAVLGGVIAGQLWGWANGRQATGTTPATDPYVNYDPAGTVSYAVLEGVSNYNIDPNSGIVAIPHPSAESGFPFEYWVLGLSMFGTQPVHLKGARVEPLSPFGWRVVGIRENNSEIGLFVGGFGVPVPIIWSNTRTQPTYPQQPGLVPPPPLPLPEPVTEPNPSPELPRSVPPFVVPTIPGSRPTSPAPTGVPAPTTPRTSPPPATLPDRPLTPFPGWPVQPRVPGTATTPEGTVAPTPKPPVVKTPTNVHVVDGIPIPGNGPRPTPEGTAQELGRIEKKLARLLDPGSDSPEQPRDRLGWLRDNIADIIDFFQSVTAGGTYELSSPCQLDENGDRVVKEVAYAGAPQSLGVISNKIDALAQLLQEHKDLKQPICRETPATGGQAVTVNFVQVD